MDHLVSFGFYYKPDDIKKLLEPLMSLIDGRNDKPYPNVTGEARCKMQKTQMKKIVQKITTSQDMLLMTNRF